jgi:hypothetical protein
MPNHEIIYNRDGMRISGYNLSLPSSRPTSRPTSRNVNQINVNQINVNQIDVEDLESKY